MEIGGMDKGCSELIQGIYMAWVLVDDTFIDRLGRRNISLLQPFQCLPKFTRESVGRSGVMFFRSCHVVFHYHPLIEAGYSNANNMP